MQDWSYKLEMHKSLGTGQLLISEPFMADENFRRTVVLICEYDSQTGVVGFILNRPVKLKLSDLIDVEENINAPLRLGGPVGTDTIHCIHRFADVPGAIEIAENHFFGGHFDTIKEKLRSHPDAEESSIFFIGYSGWQMKQLHDEIKDNSWIIHPADSTIFTIPANELWKNILRKMGGVYAQMAEYPEDPEMN